LVLTFALGPFRTRSPVVTSVATVSAISSISSVSARWTLDVAFRFGKQHLAAELDLSGLWVSADHLEFD
jgi:energy-converting hydrogenase Eha subunit H